MIFTNCPNCNNVQIFNYNYTSGGYFPSRCSICNEVMWVENKCLGGVTRPHSLFKKEVMMIKGGIKDEPMIDEAAKNAIYESIIR